LANHELSEAEASTLVGKAKHGPHVQLWVNDNGCGIPQEEQSLIFDPFYSKKNIEKGTGLGLASSLGIVRSLNGGFDVDSEVGKGTTFSVYLPASPGAEIHNASESSEKFQQGKGQRILVVDDEPLVVELLCQTLKHHHYHVQGVTSGSEALKLLRSDPDKYDALLTDVIMEGVDGGQLAKESRKLIPDLPILFMSGYTNQDVGGKLRDFSEIPFLYKPIKVDDLLQKVDGLFA
jgi:CheY-like chemotaxis protein